MPRSIPVRLLRLAITAVIGLSIAIPLRITIASHSGPISGAVFDALFDFNFRTSQPIVYDAIRNEPALYRLLQKRTKAAYLKDGWPGASDAFYAVLSENIVAYADDAHIVRRARAYHAVEAKLSTDPDRCKRYGLTSYNDVDWQSAKEEGRILGEAYRSTVVNGAPLWHEGVRRPKPPDDAWWSAFLATVQDPEQLSPDEINALLMGKDAPAPIWCAANLKQDRNLLARPEAQAAELYRIMVLYRDGEGGRRFLPMLPTKEPGKPPASEQL